MKEHESNICSTNKKLSVISEHRIKNNHDFNRENVKILDNEPNYFKRLVSEMIHIKKEDNTINKQTDTTNLNAIYDKYINYFDLICGLQLPRESHRSTRFLQLTGR